ASLLFASGCKDTRTSDYPDQSPHTVRREDDVRQNAREQKDAADLQADRASARFDYREQQIRDQYAAKRQAHVNENHALTTERDAKVREIQIQAKHDKDVIDAETAEKVRTSSGDESAKIRADAAMRKSEIDNRTTGKLAPHATETTRNNSRNVQRGIELDREESKEISALEQERATARNQTRDKKLEIDQWLNEEMAKIEKDSNAAARQSNR
ncbi:MAG: hypothetical protein EA402_00075, partial [Planctomycetota bacterium]